MVKLTLKRLSAEDEYPDLSQHNNYMAKVLTQDMYKKLRERATPSGFTIDGVIQTGVDNPGTVTVPVWALTTQSTFNLWGCLFVYCCPRSLVTLLASRAGHPFIMTVGCVAGDEETYEVFKDLLDPVIEDRHGGYKPTDKHKTDLNSGNLKVPQLCHRLTKPNLTLESQPSLMWLCSLRVVMISIPTTCSAPGSEQAAASAASVCHHTAAEERDALWKSFPLKVRRPLYWKKMVSDSDCTLLQITKLIYTDGDGLPPDDCYIKATTLCPETSDSRCSCLWTRLWGSRCPLVFVKMQHRNKGGLDSYDKFILMLKTLVNLFILIWFSKAQCGIGSVQHFFFPPNCSSQTGTAA